MSVQDLFESRFVSVAFLLSLVSIVHLGFLLIQTFV